MKQTDRSVIVEALSVTSEHPEYDSWTKFRDRMQKPFVPEDVFGGNNGPRRAAEAG